MTRSNSALPLIILVLLCILFTPYAVAAAPSVYKVLVDEKLGFRNVRIIEPANTQFNYENYTLNINAGDTVIWENQAYDDTVDLTILSEQNLWNSSTGYLKYVYWDFDYTFTEPGTYQVSVKEYPRVSKQTIVVAPVGTPALTAVPFTPIVTEIATPTITVTVTAGQSPSMASPYINFWYILIAFIVVAGIVIFIIYFNKK